MDRLQGDARWRVDTELLIAHPVHHRADHGVATGVEPDRDTSNPSAAPDLGVLGTSAIGTGALGW
jgi:hypothetical protein